MPATEVSPALRRRISDDARELLRSAFEQPDLLSPHRPIADPTEGLTARLQNFRARLRLELLADDADESVLSALELRLAVSTTTFLARYHAEALAAEVSVANRAGVSTSWVTLADGSHRQLQGFLDDPAVSLAAVKGPIRSLLAMLDLLDLSDLLAACASAVPVRGGRELYAVGDKNSYVFAVDGTSGCPTSITLSPLQAAGDGVAAKLRLVLTRYTRFSGDIDVPRGVKSDVQLMVDTAMDCLARWSRAGQRQLAQVFDALDTDEDGWVSARDVARQLVEGAGQAPEQAARVAGELARLLGNGEDPAEEFAFREFAGFWITMLADSHLVSDPRNEQGVLAALDKLFFGQ